ncbi:MAG: adenylosuccinate lyase family protein [Gemmatimonadota bacterium]
MSERFTAGRVPDAGIEQLLGTRARWQAWLTVESALASTQAELGLIPREAADAIAAAATLDRVDAERIRDGIRRSSHPFMPVVVELSRAVGEPHGGWVHWGATTQNITQTGDLLVVRDAHRVLLGLLGRIMVAFADLADRGADMVMAGRTHGQHAVPITFGFKVAGWIDEMSRHTVRLRELEPRLFVALIGGAAGTFAGLGERGPEVQAGVAKRLGLEPSKVASRSAVDQYAELACVLGLLGATCGKLAREIYTLMRTEFGELEEPVPAGTVGSSTMPQKRNPQLCQDVLGISAELRALVPLVLECVQSEHEADHTPTVAFDAVIRGLTISGEALERILLVARDMRIHPQRMRANLDLSGGMVSAEAVMLELGKTLGRQRAHDVVFEAAQSAAARGASFTDLLAADPRLKGHLSRGELDALIDPVTHTGLASRIARAQADVARSLGEELEAHVATQGP